MKKMPKLRHIESAELVDIFLDFFKRNDHLKISGHSLLPDNDPSLLFINSGMAPMKRYFLGQEQPPAPRLCDLQRCIRTNDIEEVGDRHHLTFFEMMGSWSIGDYWKQTAIELAWELLTQGFGYPPDALYATVYAGNDALGIPADTESARIWRQIGLAEDHIVRLGDDNFWGPAGEYGPCGPCTEVFYDTGDAYGERYIPGGHFDDVNRYIEIWNAGVFMEFNKLPSGLSALDMKSVDTGSGLERMLMALNGYDTVYETDLLRPLVEFVTERVERLSSTSRSTRIIADHIRSSVMIMADGVPPSNTGPGYIPRRLIRRAIAAAYQNGATAFDFAGIVDLAIANAGPWNPQVTQNREQIRSWFSKEQADFESVLDTGLRKLSDEFSRLQGKIDGNAAFNFFSTYGLPVDTIQDYFESHGGSFDKSGFEEALADHQRKSRNIKNADEGRELQLSTSAYPMTEFVGYTQLTSPAQVIGLTKDGASVPKASAGEEVLIVLDRTSFYAEGGGQVSDRGTIRSPSGTCEVRDIFKTPNGVFVHTCRVTEGQLAVDEHVETLVDEAFRRSVQANHSGTHLLHAALRKVLGDSVTQAGSLVDAERLRFDFTYGEKVSDENLVLVENLVNDAIRANLPGAVRTMSFDEAMKGGALAFFEEKYGDEVRTVTFGDVSMELCGGTHVASTGEIGLLVITSEGSVARGVRRVQALTGRTAFDHLRSQATYAKKAAHRLNVSPSALEERIGELMKSSKKAESGPGVPIKDLAKQASALQDGTPAVIAQTGGGSKELRSAGIELASLIDGVAILVTEADGKVHVAVSVAKSQTSQWTANGILVPLLKHVGGKGGGKATFAQGGGPDITGLTQLMTAARAL